MDQLTESDVDVPLRKRPGMWTKLGGPALSVAILLHVALLVWGLIWVFQRIPAKAPPEIPVARGRPDGTSAAQSQADQKNSVKVPPSTDLARIAVDRPSTVVLPDPGDRFGEMASIKTLGGESGTRGLINGPGTGPPGNVGGDIGARNGPVVFKLIPETMSKRCSPKDRLARLKETGGTPACEEAVVKALRWLKANQRPDGSWGNHPAAMTGLALLAFFGHCETPASQEFGDTTLRGIVYLINLGSKSGGRLTSDPASQAFCYEHAIATYALAEAATFYKNLKDPPPGLMEITAQAGQFIIDHQNDNKGWAYQYAVKGGHTDLSVVGWQLQALKACSHTGIRFEGMRNCVNKGLRYVNDCQNADLGSYGYTGPTSNHGDYWGLTGVGMLCNQMWGKGARNEVDKGARYVLKNTRLGYHSANANLYAHYYESQAMMQRSQDEWNRYNNLFRDQILKGQETDGSWKAPGDPSGKIEGAGSNELIKDRVYRTCLCTLMLEVYYRFLSTGSNSDTIP